MSRLSVLNGRRRGVFAALVANGLGQAAAAAGGAMCVRAGFDRVVAGSPATGSLWPLAAGFAAAIAFGAWLRVRERVDAEKLGFDYTADLRAALFDRLTKLSPFALERRSDGEVLLRFVGDLAALKQWVSYGLAKVTVAGVTVIAALAALGVLNWPIALAAGVGLSVGAVLSVPLNKPLDRAVRLARRRRARLSAFVAERVVAMRAVRVMGGRRREVRRLARQTAGLRAAALGRARAAGRMRAVSQLTMGLASFAVLAVGALEVTGGRTTPGSVVAAMSLMGLLTPAVHGCGRVFELWHAARVCREKVAGLLAAGPLVSQARRARPLAPGRGELVFRKVSVRRVVRRLSARVPAGSVVALVGPNGAGKSTLLALATRLMDPDAGRVRLDGCDLRRVTTRSLHAAVALVGADVPLLRGSLSENLRYRAPGASREEVERVAALCGVDQLIARLPKGERFAVADRGRNLSLGERQRVLLARALLGRPRLLLLDEADANLDEPVAEAVAAALEGYPGTVLMVTQRPSWLARADFVWRLEAGRLVEIKANAGAEGETKAKIKAKPSLVPASNVVPLAGAVEP